MPVSIPPRSRLDVANGEDFTRLLSPGTVSGSHFPRLSVYSARTAEGQGPGRNGRCSPGVRRLLDWPLARHPPSIGRQLAPLSGVAGCLVGRLGLEPRTYGLKVRSSTD